MPEKRDIESVFKRPWVTRVPELEKRRLAPIFFVIVTIYLYEKGGLSSFHTFIGTQKSCQSQVRQAHSCIRQMVVKNALIRLPMKDVHP